MMLEAGRWYRRRDGQVVGPVIDLDALHYPHALEYVFRVGAHSYTADGCFLAADQADDWDLVELAPDPEPELPINALTVLGMIILGYFALGFLALGLVVLVSWFGGAP